MDLLNLRREVESRSFRDFFESLYLERGRILPTLSDEESAVLFVVSKIRKMEPDKIMNLLPEECKDHFEMLQKVKTKYGWFFNRFALFARPTDGVLVGFGNDDMYYVLIVWDGEGRDLWKPDQNLFD